MNIRITSAKTGWRFKVERETKIKYSGSREGFMAKARALKAKLLKPTRLIDDLRYLPGENFKPGATKKIRDAFFLKQIDETRVETALKLLGFKINGTLKELKLHYPKDMSDTTVRLRNDGGKWIFTVKGSGVKPKANDYIEEKPEFEMEVKDPTAFKKMLRYNLGFKLESHRQKLRTSYKLKTGQIVELNESPAFKNHNVPFWIEIEGQSLAEIERAAKAFGFSKQNFFKGSEKAFLMKIGGLSEEKTKHLLF